MKKSILLLLAITAITFNTVYAQDTLRLFGNRRTPKGDKETKQTNPRPVSDIQTLTGPGRKVGFYLGFNSGYSQIGGKDAFGAGGSVALIANHSLAIGFAGKGFVTETFSATPESSTRYDYSGGYGGLLIEPILFPKSPVHLSFPVILGAGGIAKGVLYNYYYPYEYTQVEIEDAEAFFIAEPGIELELNVARWLRFGLGCSYRLTTRLEPAVFDSKIMDGFTGGFSMKFGKF